MKKYYLYIVLTRTNTGISKIIQLIKKDEYTHAAISLDKDLNHMYSFGRRKMNKEAYSDDKFLCSEFVYYILKESGVADLKIPRNLVRPQSGTFFSILAIIIGSIEYLFLEEY